MFTLYEELMLLTIHESKGTFLGSSEEHLKSGLGGAILAELALRGVIYGSDSHRLRLQNDSETNEPILDKVIKALKETEKERKFSYWINNLNLKTEKFRQEITDGLVKKGILTQEEDRLLWVVPAPAQPEMKASAKFLLKRRLRGIVLAQEEFQARDIALLSLMRACGWLDLIFLRDERKLADRFIHEMIFSQAIQDPAIQAVQEIETVISALVEED
jgi:hypothetical protein